MASWPTSRQPPVHESLQWRSAGDQTVFDIIRKSQYWAALDDQAVFRKLGGFSLTALDGLKHIQDAWTLARLLPERNRKILEIGGGASRVLPALDASNERWNLDEFQGAGNGVVEVPDMPDVRLVRRKLGDFPAELPDDYFDVAFSISVIEHIPGKELDAFLADHARVLAPGGIAVHTVDLYIGDEPDPAVARRLDAYLELPRKHGLDLVDRPGFHGAPAFRCDMASNSDWGMWRWNKAVPHMADTRRTHQSVSLAMVLKKA